MNGGRGREVGADSSGRLPTGPIRWRSVLLDVVIVALWVAVVSVAWRYLPWPTWAYYVVVFGGIVGYSILIAPVADAGRGRRR